MKKFSYFEPAEFREALSLLVEHKGKAKVLAGGTELIPQMKRGLSAPGTIIHLKGISALREISESEEGLRIGAAVTLGSLERNPRLASGYPGLHAAVTHVAVPAVRNSGTIGGNVCLDTKCIYRDQVQTWDRALPPCFKSGGERCYVVRGGKTCHASLAADTVPILIALKAKAKVLSLTGERVIPVEELYTGNGIRPLNLSETELLAEISIPRHKANGGAAYFRYSLRKAIDFPTASAAVFLAQKNGTCTEARVVLGAVAPWPLRLLETEKALNGQRITEAGLQDCARQASQEALQISKSGRMDLFTREIASSLVFQALKKAWQV
jgi:4-hydroxybenzoyl-CoA reductase subunit beta